jgi:uncharacterized protein (DUF488 family)
MKIFTIGFTQRSAAAFFGALRASGARRVVDVRLHNVSQIAGFTKRGDLPFFLREICGMDYLHLPVLAPSQELLDAYKKQKLPWTAYERRFRALIRARRIEAAVQRSQIAEGCLLCSEPSPAHCHRRLVAEHLRDRWRGVEIVHLT